MGVDLGSLFESKPISFEDLQGRIVVIDAYNVLHQFLASIRQRDGTPLMNSEGKITSHLTGLLHRTANLVEAGIRPVYSFDGRPHPLKARTIEERRKRKEKAEEEWRIAIEAGDVARARSMAARTGRLTDPMVDEAKELLTHLGIPYVQAVSDGEAQACYMASRGDAYAVGSQDFDCILFGAPILVRNLTSSDKRKLPGKQAHSKITPKMIRLEESLDTLGVTRAQLVDMAILMGNDFTKGVHGIGPKTALKLLKAHGSLEEVMPILEEKGKEVVDMKLVDEVRSIFLEPKVVDEYDLVWGGLDRRGVLDLMCRRNGFSRDRTEGALNAFSIRPKPSEQKGIFEF